MALIETYITLSIVSTAIRLPHLLNLDTIIFTYDSIVKELSRSHINLAVAVNTIFTLLLLVGKLLQYLFFGKLREIEERNFRERFFLYVVTKFFIFAVKDHELGSMLMWGFWFSVQCFLKLFSLLSRDRFEYLNTFSPNTHAKIHFKLLFLLVSILLSDLMCFYFSTSFFFNAGLSNIMILNFEFFTIFFETIQTLIKYSIHLFDMALTGVWEQRGAYIYYTEFATDSIILAGTCFHLIHIVIIQGMPTLLDLVLFSYFKGVFTELKRKIIGYKNYCKLVEDMDTKYLNATEQELILYNDDCAICREKMETAKKLPCNHIFHHSCLRSWLEQQTSCPTCRRSLIELQNENNHQQQQQNSNSQNSVNSADVSSIHDLFPHISTSIIENDLRITQNVNETINNILEGGYNQNTQDNHNQNNQPADTTQHQSSNSISINGPTSIPTTKSHINNINNNNNNNYIIQNEDTLESSSSSNTTCTFNQSQTNHNQNINQQNNEQTFTLNHQIINHQLENNNNSNSKSSSEQQQTFNINNTSTKLEKFSDSFKNSPIERKSSLLERKRLMLEASRKHFLEDMEKSNNNNNQ